MAENQDEFNVEMGTSDGPIALFTTYYKHETGVDFWSLATAKEKAGKRFMYSRSKKITNNLLFDIPKVN